MTAYPCCCFAPGIREREIKGIKKVNKLVNNLNPSLGGVVMGWTHF
jgi:hypothetical protein